MHLHLAQKQGLLIFPVKINGQRKLTCSSANHVELGRVSVIFLTDDGNRDVVLVFIMTDRASAKLADHLWYSSLTVKQGAKWW